MCDRKLMCFPSTLSFRLPIESKKMLTDLYLKYKAAPYGETDINPLSFILRKAELGVDLTSQEGNWLHDHSLYETYEIISKQEEYRKFIRKEVGDELIQLKKNPFISGIYIMPSVESKESLILYKVHVRERLSGSEFYFVKNEYHNLLIFDDRKQKYGITEDIPFEETAIRILQKIESSIPLCTADIRWLVAHNAHSFLQSVESQFSRLQNTYKAVVQDGFKGDLLSLFLILQKLDESKFLEHIENQFLRENGFNETLLIAQQNEFSALKLKYHATQSPESNISSHLYKVLRRLDTENLLPEADINYLKKRKLVETIKCAYKKPADHLMQKMQQGDSLSMDDLTWCEEHHYEDIAFMWLKMKYEIKDCKTSSDPKLHGILKNLEAGGLLKDGDEVWLRSKDLLQRSSKISIAHYTLKAQFEEKEFARTKDHWHVVNASADWRKADNPENALKLTENLILEYIKLSKLRAALLTTRGGALRDIGKNEDAEKCAREAIEYYPDNHNPYTLMGALCFDASRYQEGLEWFAEAVKRGAKEIDQDSEIKRILRKNQNKDLIDYLLKEDPYRFAWAKSFSVKSINRQKRSDKTIA